MIILELWEWAVNLFVIGVASVLLMISSYGFLMLVDLYFQWRTKR
jgi:hypothetical protein